MDIETVSLIQSLRNKPDRQIRIYRAIQKTAKPSFNIGDWVTVNKKYAIEHGQTHLQGNPFRIISKVVYARDIYTNGDSIHEWGYDPQPFEPFETRNPKYLPKRLQEIKAWVRANCKFATSEPAVTCLELIKTGQLRDAAVYFRSLAAEQQGEVAAMMAQIIQTEEGGFAGWQKRDEAGEPHPAGPDMDGFWIEVKKLDRGWGQNPVFAMPVKAPSKPRPKRKPAPMTSYPTTGDEAGNAEIYFNLGHGEENEHGSDPRTHIVWVLMGRDEIDTASGDKTHGMVWGHDHAGKTWKGRYEGDTGRLSIAAPDAYLQPPSWLMTLLEQKFGWISEVHSF